MKTAVIIVNYNDIQNTVEYVNKIKEYSIIDRIVVVDNLSTTTGAFEKLKELENQKVYVIQSDKNGGYNYGNNCGIWFLEEKAVLNCLNVLEKNKDVAVVAPKMLNKENKPIRRSAWKIRTFGLDVIHSTRFLELLFYKKLRNGEYSKKDYEQEKLEVDAISGAFFIIKNEVLKEIGFFDENVFLFYEEDILAKTLKDKNYKTISLNTENFIHYESQTIGKTFSYYKKIKQLYKSKMYYQEKYNKINSVQKIIFKILNIFRKIELLIEIPVRKIFKK